MMMCVRAVDPTEAAAALRSVLDAVDRGEVDARAAETAYLAGAVQALEAIAGQPVGNGNLAAEE
jgi:hypothetical protein